MGGTYLVQKSKGEYRMKQNNKHVSLYFLYIKEVYMFFQKRGGVHELTNL